MAKSSSTSKTFDDNGDITSETESTSTTESDSIVLKRNSKGEVSWDIKAYGIVDNGTESADLRNKVTQIDSDLKSQYHKD
jgi:hypothetical protein